MHLRLKHMLPSDELSVSYCNVEQQLIKQSLKLWDVQMVWLYDMRCVTLACLCDADFAMAPLPETAPCTTHSK